MLPFWFDERSEEILLFCQSFIIQSLLDWLLNYFNGLWLGEGRDF